MSKFTKIKLELAKMLAKFSDIKTDKAVLTYDSDEDLREGMDVYVADEKGPGNANHKYDIVINDSSDPGIAYNIVTINFQKGPRKDINSIHSKKSNVINNWLISLKWQTLLQIDKT